MPQTDCVTCWRMCSSCVCPALLLCVVTDSVLCHLSSPIPAAVGALPVIPARTGSRPDGHSLSLGTQGFSQLSANAPWSEVLSLGSSGHPSVARLVLFPWDICFALWLGMRKLQPQLGLHFWKAWAAVSQGLCVYLSPLQKQCFRGIWWSYPCFDVC